MLAQSCRKKYRSLAFHVIFHYFQAYHSALMDADTKLVGNMALLPLKTQFKGPAARESKTGFTFVLFRVFFEI